MILSLTEPYVIIYLVYCIFEIQFTTQDLRAVYASRLDLGDQMDPNSAIIRALGLILVNLRLNLLFSRPSLRRYQQWDNFSSCFRTS